MPFSNPRLPSSGSSYLRSYSLRLNFTIFPSHVTLTLFVCITAAISMAFVGSHLDATSCSCEPSSHNTRQDPYMFPSASPNDHGIATNFPQIPDVPSYPPFWCYGFSGFRGNSYGADAPMVHLGTPIHVSSGATIQGGLLFDYARSIHDSARRAPDCIMIAALIPVLAYPIL